MTFLDKVMMRHLLLFSVDLTEAYEKYDLAEVSRLIHDFTNLTTDLYLDFSRKRLSSA
jgi:isoleucyl-tRNA synthetase